MLLMSVEKDERKMDHIIPICLYTWILTGAAALICSIMTLLNFIRKKPKTIWITLSLIATVLCFVLAYALFWNDSSPAYFMRGINMDGH
jgi:hypothetical protein